MYLENFEKVEKISFWLSLFFMVLNPTLPENKKK